MSVPASLAEQTLDLCTWSQSVHPFRASPSIVQRQARIMPCHKPHLTLDALNYSPLERPAFQVPAGGFPSLLGPQGQPQAPPRPGVYSRARHASEQGALHVTRLPGGSRFGPDQTAEARGQMVCDRGRPRGWAQEV